MVIGKMNELTKSRLIRVINTLTIAETIIFHFYAVNRFQPILTHVITTSSKF